VIRHVHCATLWEEVVVACFKELPVTNRNDTPVAGSAFRSAEFKDTPGVRLSTTTAI
jgi:hypothetical protein